MNVRKKYLLILSFFIFISLCVLFSVYFLNSNFKKTYLKRSITDKLVKNIFEVNIIRNEIIAENNPESIKRLREKHNNIIKLIDNAEKNFKKSEHLDLIENIDKKHKEIDILFLRLGIFKEKNISEVPSKNLFKDINSKLDKNIKNMINLVFKLEELALSSFLNTNRITSWLSYILILILIGLSLIIFFIFNRDIIRPVLKIENGARKIGQGKLDYKININKNTEIGDLADEINQMTDQLKSTLISKEKLEKEIRIRKRLEKENNKHLKDLKIKQKELKKLNKKLTVSNKELEQFAYIASHDLQEPLRKVRNFAELLGDKYKNKLDKKADKYLYYITDGSERMQTLIDDLLTYSRLNTRKKPFSNIDMNDLLEKVKNRLGVLIREKNAKIIIDILPEVFGDREQLIQVFQNLISNSIKFNISETPKVEIISKKEDKFIKFAIKDNGIGINTEKPKRIFKIFKRLHTRKEFKGTGIGLAICNKIVSRHGGKIWFENNDWEGTTFYFTIKKNIKSEEI